MDQLNRSRIALGVSVLLLFAIVTSVIFPIEHASAKPSVTIMGSNLTGGTITFQALTPITLNGEQQTSTASWPIANVIDARGNGSGWNVSVTLTPFAEYDTNTANYVRGGKTLASSSLVVSSAPTIALADSTSSTVSGMTVVSTNTAIDTGVPIKIASAPAIKGMGSYTFTVLGVTLTIPANTYAATYRSNATVTLSSGP